MSASPSRTARAGQPTSSRSRRTDRASSGARSSKRVSPGGGPAEEPASEAPDHDEQAGGSRAEGGREVGKERRGSVHKPYVFVETSGDLKRLVRTLARQHQIGFDTEANSMFAYKERICLVQISTRARDYIIDPLAVDLALLGPALADPGLVKILHGAEFDILLLKRELGIEFAGLFDTRVAAASLGCEAPGLAAVLDEWLGEKLDKRYQRSDWGKRPLSDGQLDYARSDTCFLLELAESMRADLREQGSPHLEEVAAECRRLEALEPEIRRLGMGELLKVKGAGTLDGEGRRALAAVNALRHRLAESRDVPLFKVFGNDVVLELARRRPATRRELESSKVLPAKLLSRYGADLAAALTEAREAGPLRDRDVPAPCSDGDDSLNVREAGRYEAVRQWRRGASDERGVEANLILTRAQMLALARHTRPLGDVDDLVESGLLEIWRARHYGEGIVEALAGATGKRRGSRRER